jgi:hypothetical protein
VVKSVRRPAVGFVMGYNKFDFEILIKVLRGEVNEAVGRGDCCSRGGGQRGGDSVVGEDWG